nr:MAG TPA: hypothetical protein [Caudoviricetes sp.]
MHIHLLLLYFFSFIIFLSNFFHISAPYLYSLKCMDSFYHRSPSLFFAWSLLI